VDVSPSWMQPTPICNGLEMTSASSKVIVNAVVFSPTRGLPEYHRTIRCSSLLAFTEDEATKNPECVTFSKGPPCINLLGRTSLPNDLPFMDSLIPSSTMYGVQ
jgi:hypothetical protein